MSQPEWLIELDIAGATLRYATRDVDVVDSSGNVLRYRAGLADFTMSLDGLEQEQGIQIVDRTINWAQIVARGSAIDLSAARLRFWEPGTLLENARMVIDGLIEAPEYGFPQAPGQLVVTIRVRGSRQVKYPPARALINDTTFTFNENVEQYDPNVEGAIYPVVLGTPGLFPRPGGGSYSRPATPALLVHVEAAPTDDALLSLGVVEATEVLVYDAEGLFDSGGGISLQKTDQLDVETDADLIGQAISVATGWALTPTSADLSPIIGNAFYAAWSVDGGGITHGGALIRSFTDVALWALRNSGSDDVDLEAQEGERANLDAFKIDGFINEQLNLIDWIERQFGRLLPIARTRSSKGIYWRFIDWAATTTDAVARIDADTGLATRRSAIRTTKDQIANEFSIRYGRVLTTNTWAGFRGLAAEAGVAPDDPGIIDARWGGSSLCAASKAQYGRREAKPIETWFVWDFNIAELILRHLSLRDALPRRFVTYEAPSLHRLRRGDIVTVTDAEVGFDDVVAIVDAVVLSSGRLHRVNLEILDRAVRATA